MSPAIRTRYSENIFGESPSPHGIASAALRQVREAFEQYQVGVDTDPLKPSTKTTYLLYVENFVCSLRDFFLGVNLMREN